VRAGMFNWGLNPPQRAVYVIQEQVCCTERAYSRQAPHGAGLRWAEFRHTTRTNIENAQPDHTGRTSLNLGIDRVYHPRMEKEGRPEKPNEIKPDEY
jgi:hypothetical protein